MIDTRNTVLVLLTIRYVCIVQEITVESWQLIYRSSLYYVRMHTELKYNDLLCIVRKRKIMIINDSWRDTSCFHVIFTFWTINLSTDRRQHARHHMIDHHMIEFPWWIMSNHDRLLQDNILRMSLRPYMYAPTVTTLSIRILYTLTILFY